MVRSFMIFLEKSKLPFPKCLTKNYIITPSPEQMSIPLKRRISITPPPLPIYIPITTLRIFSFLSNFLYFKKLTMRNCVLVLHSNNIENRP